jgi:uncharacterized protein (UPF0276 family)
VSAATPPAKAKQAVPVHAGIGLRAPHYRALLERRPAVGFIEVHSENFFGAGGQPHYFLRKARELYPLSLHGVGLSLGSADALDERHLGALQRLIALYDPLFVSEHLSWCSYGGRYANELLPLPYTEEALAHVCARVAAVQERLRRRILVENVSAYVRFRHSTMPEWEFVREVCRRTGCGLLLDVNNAYVNAVNQGFSAEGYIDAIPAQAVEEIHLAGYEDTGECLVDTHGQAVHAPVWALYRRAIERLGPIPTLIEWDTDIPALPVLLGEARKAQSVMNHGFTIAA